MLDLAKEYDTPVLQSNAITSEVVNDIINFLNDFLAPKTRIHGTLLDIDGIGVLLTGISGVGKSETALELIHRGHMLVADDAVELKVIKDTIQGSSPDKIQDFIELRGVGFINVRNMYGVAGILRKPTSTLLSNLSNTKNRMITKEATRRCVLITFWASKFRNLSSLSLWAETLRLSSKSRQRISA